MGRDIYAGIKRGCNTKPTQEDMEREIEVYQSTTGREDRFDCPPFDITRPVYYWIEPLPYKNSMMEKDGINYILTLWQDQNPYIT